jgi:transcriptional regulator with GAF, ATPase, and Fis domain
MLGRLPELTCRFVGTVGWQSVEAAVFAHRDFDAIAADEVDVRIIAATNRDLLKAVHAQAFREDLYYRLSVFPIALPPLRDRAEDIALLVRFLVDRFAARVGKRIDGVSRETMTSLVTYRWPGNVRELGNVLERAVILATGPTLDPESDADLAAGPATPAAVLPAPSLEAIERRHILTVLRQSQWVIEGPRGAAQILGLHPNTLRSRLKKLCITRSAPEPGDDPAGRSALDSSS